jgi:mycoredoxin
METFDAQRITMFGAEWCGDCRRSKKLLDTLGVDYDYVDLEAVPEAADRAAALAGRKNIPVISFPDGAVQCEPSDPELHGKLSALGVI